MSVSKELVRGVLGRFALLFDAPAEARGNWGAAVDCWVGLLPIEMTEKQFLAAARVLVLELERFPVPADFVHLVNEQREAA